MRVPESSTRGVAIVMASEGDLMGLHVPVVRNGECLLAHGAPEAPVPMEVDPMAGFHFMGT